MSDRLAVGTYALVLHLPTDADLQIGRLGRFFFPAGYYVYVGSALGGLRGRLERHRRTGKPPHWHVDYLREHAGLVEINVRPGPERIECDLARTVARLDGAKVPAPRFGASDCRCPSHLFRFAARPDLARIVGGAGQR